MTKLTRLVSLVDRLRGDEGQGLAEYALILALIAIVAIVALSSWAARSATSSASSAAQLDVGHAVASRQPVAAVRQSADRRTVDAPGRIGRPRTTPAPPAGTQRPCSDLASCADFLPFPPNGPSPLV